MVLNLEYITTTTKIGFYLQSFVEMLKLSMLTKRVFKITKEQRIQYFEEYFWADISLKVEGYETFERERVSDFNLQSLWNCQAIFKRIGNRYIIKSYLFSAHNPMLQGSKLVLSICLTYCDH